MKRSGKKLGVIFLRANDAFWRCFAQEALYLSSGYRYYRNYNWYDPRAIVYNTGLKILYQYTHVSARCYRPNDQDCRSHPPQKHGGGHMCRELRFWRGRTYWCISHIDHELRHAVYLFHMGGTVQPAGDRAHDSGKSTQANKWCSACLCCWSCVAQPPTLGFAGSLCLLQRKISAPPLRKWCWVHLVQVHLDQMVLSTAIQEAGPHERQSKALKLKLAQGWPSGSSPLR